MVRLFDTHRIRDSREAAPVWDFFLSGSEWEKGGRMRMPVPGCWESCPKLGSYRGRAIYETGLELGGNVRLNFKGVSHTARVLVDGVVVGEHYNAYTEFEILLRGLQEGLHRLEVQVDNSFHEHSSLHVGNDYYSYGGITRPVLIERLGSAYIRRVHFTPWRDPEGWHGTVEAAVVNLEPEEQSFFLEFEGAGRRVRTGRFTIAGNGELLVAQTMDFPGVEEYHPESPALYLLGATLRTEDGAADDLIERVGFREIRVSGGEILMNGRPLRLHGFNRHEDYAEFGCAVPFEAMCRDMEILKDLGANCVRTCHYPNDERFLDLCDENGILVWEEGHARGLNEEQMRHPDFDRQSADCLREMVESHYNHPAIFTWGILNECASNTEYGRECYARQYGQLRSMDRSRPLTSASCHPGDDRCLDLLDIVSFNIYPGWYFDEPTGEHLAGLKAFIAATEDAGKPLIISEVGGGAVYGFRSANRAKWTEDYQEELLREQLEAILADPQISGVFIWQFADCRVDNGSFFARPKSQNNKGVVDQYRREKLAYRAVSEIFHGQEGISGGKHFEKREDRI